MEYLQRHFTKKIGLDERIWMVFVLLAGINVQMGRSQNTSPLADTYGLPKYFPLKNESFIKLSSDYGYRMHPLNQKLKKHRGIDLVAKTGSSVYASASGSVVETGFEAGYGNYVLLLHECSTKTLYGHLLSYSVKDGELVKKGQVIGEVGATGQVTGPHLHYEIWIKNKRVDPLLFWRKIMGTTNRRKTESK